jgi:disulfide bond formation protein DsbB
MASPAMTSSAQRLPLAGQLGLLAVLGSGALLGGALFFQYGLGLAPCEMCHWQRWPHMVAMVAGLAAFAASGNRKLATGLLPLVLLIVAVAAVAVTAGLGVFHAGVEYRWWAGPQACSGTIPTGLSPEELKKILFSAKMVRCDEPAWKLAGISMAGWNAILSALLAIVLGSGVSRLARSST